MNKFVHGLVTILVSVARPFFPLKIYGPRNIPIKKGLVVGNHISGWDPIMYTFATKDVPSFVYKAEFENVSFLRWVFDGLDCVPIHRGEVDIGASKKILRLLRDDKTVCLFPEGTRNPKLDCLQEFKTGAALFAIKTKSPLRPFYIWDRARPFHKNYLIIGDEFTLEQFYDRPTDKETLAEATEYIKQRVQALKDRLETILAKKGVKRKISKKQAKKLAKLQQIEDVKTGEEVTQ